LENALKEFKQIEKQEEALLAKHEKEEIHIEEADQQVEKAIEQAAQQDIVLEGLGDNRNSKAVSPSMAEIEPE
jgi:hypothetical protein